MSNWKNKLNLKDIWKAREESNITIQELGKQVAKRIEHAPFYKKYEDDLEEIVYGFKDCGEDVEEFDYVLGRLYDWGDINLLTRLGQMQRKMCWISTF